MKTTEHEAIKEFASKNELVIVVIKNGKHIPINNIDNLPYKDTTIKNYIDTLEKNNKNIINGLENEISNLSEELGKQKNAIKEILNVLAKINQSN